MKYYVMNKEDGFETAFYFSTAAARANWIECSGGYEHYETWEE